MQIGANGVRWAVWAAFLSTVRSYGVASLADKLSEALLRWHDHDLRTNPNTVLKIGMNLRVPAKWFTLHLDLYVHSYRASNWEKGCHYTKITDPSTELDRGFCEDEWET